MNRGLPAGQGFDLSSVISRITSRAVCAAGTPQ